jgi:hypothetical protein
LRFYTTTECEEWLAGLKRVKPEEVEENSKLLVPYPNPAYRIFSWAHYIATQFTYREPALLWVSEWGMWPTSENGHLYYRLRHSYGDHRLLHEAPGHLFLSHESEDLASFLQVSMLNGWGGHVLTKANYLNVFFSHDEYLKFYSKNQTLLDEVAKELHLEKSSKPR